ncbi:MAG: exodeoxyribonuclease V subunit gamma [DPANN group archaeon]|nr:exodeoxyribonuclease V subunit gamma [DPANN group archaeon]
MANIGKELDYLFVLKALDEISFDVGKKLLVDFLRGDETNKSIVRNSLDSKNNFGALAYDKEELNALIDNLVLNDMIRIDFIGDKKFWKVLKLSEKGKTEIINPVLYKKKLSFNFKETQTQITKDDRVLFDKYSEFLGPFNDEQKKAIISDNKHILCLAGAGSGKTTVLTKRIEFLVKHCAVDPKKILAITFTRKARTEMMRRLEHMDDLHIETFNSFCEKNLRRHNHLIYDKSFRVINYGDKIVMVNKALLSLNIAPGSVTNIYFSHTQKQGKTTEQLQNIFMTDCFFIRDYYKFKNRLVRDLSFETVDNSHKKSADLVFGVCNYIEAYMRKYGLRDFADQLVDAITLFEKHTELIPEFEHILVDEYQDVNSTQIKLIDILDSPNLFCVGDPRQSIYGWRGSDIRYILNFEDKYPDCDIITMSKNYRSTKYLVELINNSIKGMGLAELESVLEGEKDINLVKFSSEDAELAFVLAKIIASDLPGNEIFVLARVNRQLNEMSARMKLAGIKHIVRSNEMKKSGKASKDDVTLATVHAIKGMEAKVVFIIGCNASYFPCKGSEHPVVDMVKVEEYDKEEEERRLFYVAMSRAKESLYMTYTGKNPTYFITKSMRELIEDGGLQKPKAVKGINVDISKLSGNLIMRLKSWRSSIAGEMEIPTYCVMHDRTLLEIAQSLPKTTFELEKIHGLGPAKIVKYGDDILQIVAG